MLPPGNRKIVAYYGGDVNYASSVSAPYTLTVLAAPANGVQISPVASGMTPFIVATGDFNKDGKPDIAMAFSTFVTLEMGWGNGTFRPPNNLVLPGAAAAMVVADFNCDGNPDLAVAGNWGVSIFLGDGAGNFQAPIIDAVGNTTALTVADFNNDGVPDLLETGPLGVGAYTGTGSGTFQLSFNLGPGAGLVGDFNNDGNTDVGVLAGGAVFIYRGFGDGTFNFASFTVTAGSTAVVGDFNGDGLLDLAVSALNGPGGFLQIYLGNNNFGFQLLTIYPCSSVGNLYAIDVNGDQKADLVLSTPNSNSMQIFPGVGDGTFNAPATYNVGGLLVPADFNLDGRVDFAVAWGTTVKLLLGDLATQLVFTTQPADIQAGVAITPAVAVQFRNAGGSSVMTGGTVNITSTPAGINATTASSQGTATFNTLTLTTPGSYTLTATSGLLSSQPSVSFNVFPGPPASLSFAAPIPDGSVGVPFPAPVVVNVLDAYGNGAAGTITLTSNPPTTNPTAVALNGVATFSGLVFSTPGQYTLTASIGALNSLPSNTFNIFLQISGQVRLNGSPFSGVTVTMSNAQNGSTTTDASGNYSFNVTGAGTYVITPSRAGYLFVPQSQTFSNPVANQTANFTGRDVFGGITALSNGQFLVTNASANRAEAFDSGGNLRLQFGTAGSLMGQFNLPTGTATNANGQILVADTLNNRVEVFDSYGNFRFRFGAAGPGMGQFNWPTGIASVNGLTFVSDSGNNRVEVFDASGSFRFQFGSSGSSMGQFNWPGGISSANGMIYVVDTGNNRVEVFDTNGNFRSQFGYAGSGMGQFSRPTGILAANGMIYVADTGNSRVEVFDTSGNYRYQFGYAGSGMGQFNLPRGLALSSSNLVLVMDGGDNRVQAFDSYGNYRFQFNY